MFGLSQVDWPQIELSVGRLGPSKKMQLFEMRSNHLLMDRFLSPLRKVMGKNAPARDLQLTFPPRKDIELLVFLLQ